MAFNVTRKSVDGLEAVEVSGELDQATVGELREALDRAIEASERPILIDLGGCEFIDSTGLGLLVEAQRRLRADERPFAVCCPPSEVHRLLALTGVDEAVALFGSRDEAVASLGHGRSGATG